MEKTRQKKTPQIKQKDGIHRTWSILPRNVQHLFQVFFYKTITPCGLTALIFLAIYTTDYFQVSIYTNFGYLKHSIYIKRTYLKKFDQLYIGFLEKPLFQKKTNGIKYKEHMKYIQLIKVEVVFDYSLKLNCNF